MARLVYNNTKNSSSSHTPFKRNYGFNPRVSNKKGVDPCFQLKSVDELAYMLRILMIIYREKFSIYKNFKNNIIISMQSLEVII